jgi:hypothetical protein
MMHDTDHELKDPAVLDAYRVAWGASPVDAEAEAGFRDTVDRKAAEIDRIATERMPEMTARIAATMRHTMAPVRLKTGRLVAFHWSPADQGFVASDDGVEMTDAEYREFCQIIESRRPAGL